VAVNPYTGQVWVGTGDGNEHSQLIYSDDNGESFRVVGKFLKEQSKEIRIVAVEPENCSALMGHEPGLHQIQGIGDGFIPDILDTSLINEVIQVSDEPAIETTRQLSKDFGLLVGISSGANCFPSARVA
jgi:cysteine synthase A